MKVAIFAGSFCPITTGHVDAIRRAAKLCDKLYVMIGVNIAKKYFLPDDVRLQSVKLATADLANVECCLFDGLTTDFAESVGAQAMIKVVRSAAETDEVLNLVDINRDMWDGETIFIAASSELRHVSSSFVRELATFGKGVTQYVPVACQSLLAPYIAELTVRR